MLVHGAEQAFEVVFQDVLEIVQVSRFMHAGLQAVDLFADLRVHGLSGGATIGMPGAGGLQVALERFETLVELL
ncbi:hypothetical protein D3C87_1787900 [compost metagenome]